MVGVNFLLLRFIGLSAKILPASELSFVLNYKETSHLDVLNYLSAPFPSNTFFCSSEYVSSVFNIINICYMTLQLHP